MKCSEWEKNIRKRTDGELEEAYVAISKLSTWDAFKDNFQGLSTLKSIIGSEQMARKYKRDDLLGGAKA